jgi:hypothetical protein
VSSWRWDAVRGAIAGGVATWVMDLVTTTLLEAQPAEVTEQEESAQPNGKSSVANLLDRIQAAIGLDLDADERAWAEQAIHYALGIVPGAIYGILRRRVPLAAARGGLVFGLLLFALNDEYLNTRLGLAGPIQAYPPETHVRGLVGHAVLGAVTDTGIVVLGG